MGEEAVELVEEQLYRGADEKCGDWGGFEVILGAAPWVEDLEDHYRGLAKI
jgi:hypothetical protein